jgi:hypothetical protein
MRNRISVALALASILLVIKVWASPPAPMNSEIKVHGTDSGSPHTGYGSSGIYARVFANIDVATGSDITYNHDLVNGDSFTINSAGVYAVSYTDTSPFDDTLGITINQPSTSFLLQVSQNEVVCRESFVAVNGPIFASCAGVLGLNAGDVLRAHRNVGGSNTCDCDSNPYTTFIVSELKGN